MKRLFNLNIFKRLFFAGLFSLCCFSISARGDSEEEISPSDPYYSAIIKIDSEDALDRLHNEGVKILRRRDNLALCFVPRAKETTAQTAQKIKSRNKGVVKVEKGRRVTPSMDKARQWFDAEFIHSGESLIQPYTGKGIVTGICDLGIDPLHISFLDEEGNPRIKRVVQYKEGAGERIVLEGKAQFAEWETDTPDNWHATHVANILAGSYGSYKGMAPESDIVITTSQLTDVGLLCGAEDILDYANENGKRAVINMSMGNYTGPHDGSSLFSQYLDKIAEEAIVVLSAGNGGDAAITLPFDFTEENRSAPLAIYSTDWLQYNPYGMVDIWSRDDTPVRVRLSIQDSDNGKIVAEYPWQELHGGDMFILASDSEAAPPIEDADVMIDESFAEIFSGWFAISGEIDSENGRYHSVMEFDAHTDIMSERGKWARFIPIVEVSGNPGTHADIYADNQYTVFRRVPDGPAPGSTLSFSDLACGENVISVGMFVNRNISPLAAGGETSTDFTPGTVSKYSSYAHLADGRVMPLTVAPGHTVISAMSRFYNEAHNNETINAEEVVDGVTYSWATNSGTSMSAPYTAGVIACWLEALPGLTSTQVMEIIEASNRQDFPNQDNPRNGRGWLDPLQGLKYALTSFSGINNIYGDALSGEGDASDIRKLTFSRNELTLWNPEGIESEIRIYDFAGTLMASFRSSAAAETISLSSLSKGIYIANISGSSIHLKFKL